MDEVKDITVIDDTIKIPSSNLLKTMAGLGVGVTLGVVFYKKILVPRLESKFGMPEMNVKSARDLDE